MDTFLKFLIFLVVICLILFTILYIKADNKPEKFNVGVFDGCYPNVVGMLDNTCPPNEPIEQPLTPIGEYVDKNKKCGCQPYNSRYDFSTPSNLFVKLQ